MYVFRTMNSLRMSFWMVPASCSGGDALLLGRHDVEREHRQHGAVHRHRHAHLVERDVVEQLAHVEDRVDRHAGHADVAGDAWVVAVVAAVGGEVERDRQALLAGGEVAPVEGVGLLGGREPGVLADRPRLVHVHRGVGAAQERDDARVGVEEVDAREVVGGVDGLRRRCPPASTMARRRRHRRPCASRRGAPAARRRRRAAARRRRGACSRRDAEELDEVGQCRRTRRCRR